MGEIDNLVVFNGTDGIQDAVMQSLSKRFAAIQALRAALNAPPQSSNGSGGSPKGSRGEVPEDAEASRRSGGAES